ncbi:hypothetical protein [Methylomonas sp. Kb3]|uniref:hypothetical protein n=1 Tax=Methylomonas sp. Kb3 TaxID=1611544 RepID=UPI001054BF7B|nr:hypothetical protein [Methylomonas sp. Kb3]
MKKILCQCVNSKVGDIKISAGIRTVLILELADKNGEMFIKFFNADRTPKGNIAVGRNSDLAKLYRLAVGENPAARFSRADKLISHFQGLWFEIQSESAIGKRDGEYQRVTSIAPKNPVIADGWTITGHLIKNVRTKADKNQAIFGQRLGKNQAIFGQFLGNCNSTSVREPIGLKGNLDPMQHSTYHIGTFYIPTSKDISLLGVEKNPRSTSPPSDLASIEPTNHQIH